MNPLVLNIYAAIIGEYLPGLNGYVHFGLSEQFPEEEWSIVDAWPVEHKDAYLFPDELKRELATEQV